MFAASVEGRSGCVAYYAQCWVLSAGSGLLQLLCPDWVTDQLAEEEIGVYRGAGPLLCRHCGLWAAISAGQEFGVAVGHPC